MTADIYRHARRGLAEYAAGRPFEAHEHFEAGWNLAQGDDRRLMQALVQICAAQVKASQDNLRGVAKLLAKAALRLDDIEAVSHLGLDLVELRRQVAVARAEAEAEARRKAAIALPPDTAAAGFVDPLRQVAVARAEAEAEGKAAIALPPDTAAAGFVYLHGFASGPSSFKANAIVPGLQADGYVVRVPDLNQGDFEGLTVSRSIDQARRLLFDRTVLIGSSLGGYVAALLQRSDPRVAGLVLMAPAFDFAARLDDRHGPEQMAKWRATGRVEVEHYAFGGLHPIGYGLCEDARGHEGRPLPTVPTCIIQGRRDDVVPADVVAEVAAAAGPQVVFDLVDDDHALGATAPRALDAARRIARQVGVLPNGGD